MKYLGFRYSCLFTLIAILLIHTYIMNGSVTMAIFICSIILSLYFLTPLMKKTRIISYAIISITLFCSVFASLDTMYILPLVAFFIIEGAFLLNTKSYYILLTITLCISSYLLFTKHLPLYGLLFLLALSVCSLAMQYFIKISREKNMLYEELLGQYRALKRLTVEQEKLVRVEERTKIARDMHDSVGHNLTALLMQIEMKSIENNSANLNEIKQLARKSLEETRYAVRQLKSDETYGIQSVLQLIRKLEMESRLHIRFTLEKGVLSMPISNKQSVVLYRILQECLTNAMKYSDSKEVEIIIGKDSLQNVSFMVKNKSVVQSPIIKGFGLKNMEERVEEIGGVLHVHRTEQQFIVEGSFPMKERV